MVLRHHNQRPMDSFPESLSDTSLQNNMLAMQSRLSRLVTARPMLEVTVFDIAILVRRLGMRWLDFRPEDGIMSAEGNLFKLCFC